MKIKPTMVIHGGAWAIPVELTEASIAGVKAAACRGYDVMLAGGSATDAVQAAVCVMEDDPVFDAGRGSVLTSEGQVEMDAVIMEGKHLEAGAVACVKNIANPVRLARLVMDKTDHTLLVGEGANAFAKEMGIEEKHPEELITDAAKKEFERFLQFKTAVNVSFRARESVHDTVGAVALDGDGNVAFATSTGGITAKRPGRVGDSPIIGSGGYCDNFVGAVSTTGHGEAISKVCLAHHIYNLMQQGHDAQSAVQKALAYMARRVHGTGGAVVVSNQGNIGVHFTTLRMPWASMQDGVLQWGIDPGDKFSEPYDTSAS